MIKYPTSYLAIKQPKDADYYIIASHKRHNRFQPLTCINDLPIVNNEVRGFIDFTAENSSLKLCIEKLEAKLSPEELLIEAFSTEEEIKEYVPLEGLLIFDFNLGINQVRKAEAYVFNPIIIEERKDEFWFLSNKSYLTVNVLIDGERVKLLDEPIKSPNYYDLSAFVKLINPSQ